jgi:hypothetical protein
VSGFARDTVERIQNRLVSSMHKRRLEREFRALIESAPPRAGRGDAGPKVAVATFGSGCWHLVLEILLAHALERRGARAELLLCDLPELPICDERTVFTRRGDRCPGCIDDKRGILESCGLPWRGVRSLVTADAQVRAHATVRQVADADLEAFVFNGWPVGSWLHVSGCHFLRRDARGDAPDHVAVRRRLLVSALVIVEAVERWLDEVKPDVVIAESGAHFMWRIASELAQARGVRVVCREMGKGGWDRHIYAINRDCMDPDLENLWRQARGQPLTAAEEADVDAFLADLPARTYDDRPPAATATAAVDLRAELGISPASKVAVAFTNVTWDLATAGRDVAFSGVFDWLRETIGTLARHPEVRLIVRAHPAEARVTTGERILDQIRQAWPAGLPGVILLEPEQPISAAALCGAADLVLAYNSTAGLESVIRGRTTVVCGNPHYRGKGFTVDIDSRRAYADWLDTWAAGNRAVADPGAIALARQYFHLFFLRYHVPMTWTTSPLEPPYRLVLRTMADLEPGRNPALDVVCDGILNGPPIVLPRGFRTEALA